jgi:hypothetical protein
MELVWECLGENIILPSKSNNINIIIIIIIIIIINNVWSILSIFFVIV